MTERFFFNTWLGDKLLYIFELVTGYKVIAPSQHNPPEIHRWSFEPLITDPPRVKLTRWDAWE